MSVKVKKDMQVSSKLHIIEVRTKRIVKRISVAAAEVMGAGSGVILSKTHQSPAQGTRWV